MSGEVIVRALSNLSRSLQNQSENGDKQNKRVRKQQTYDWLRTGSTGKMLVLGVLSYTLENAI